jgi:hypothetical protein
LNGSGDTSVEWDRAAHAAGDVEAQAAVAEAERIFAAARATGAVAFKIGTDKEATRLDTFDPTATEILVIPALVGG